MRAIALWSTVLLVLFLFAGLFFLFDRGMRRHSLLSLGYAYEAAAVDDPGILQTNLPFCGGKALQEISMHESSCSKMETVPPPCRPTTHALEMPDGYFDPVKVRLLVTGLNANEISARLREYETVDPRKIELGTGSDAMLGSPKHISAVQCDGYANLLIEQAW